MVAFWPSYGYIVPIYDGRTRQLNVPDELRNVPAILPRYYGEIPYHSLVLAAYTVSLYHPSRGSRKDQPTISLNLSFAVVLQDELLDSPDGDDEDDEQEDEAVEEDGDDVIEEDGEEAADL